jgi:RNA polymerase sigma factor (sigma-70 family)
MNSATDQQLLREYHKTHSEAAFAELVRRYVDLVYSAALRMCRDPHMAEDISQSVFVALAGNARQLLNRPVLAGWLHRTTQNLTANAIRSEVRRRVRETIAMKELSVPENDLSWERIAPHLDTALSELNEAERDALLLRYFQQKSARAIAEALGISDEAAQKRVSRAVEKLRDIFGKRGLTIGAAGLAGLISANAVQLAPAGLGMVIGTTVAASAAGAVTTIATHTAITLMKLKFVTAMIGAAAVAVTGTYLVQQREASRMRTVNHRLAAARETLASERDAALAAAKARQDELERLRSDQNELLRLRAEVNRLRQLQPAKSQNAQTLPATTGAAQSTPHTPGTYVTSEALAHVGYATPEAALETFTWAIMHGTYDQANEALGPDQVAAELNDPNGKENFETGRDKAASLFKGFQIIARKQVAEDKVELKVKYDSDENMKKAAPKLADYSIQRMVKFGDQWKLGGSTRNYSEDWDSEGQVQAFVQ